MSNSSSAARLTFADYRKTPDDVRYELLAGQLVANPTPNEVHQRISMALVILLWPFVKRHNLGHVYAAPFDVVLSNTDVVQPDLLFIANERAHIITDENVRGAPDLVIEILSPATATRDQTFKRSLYAKHGVKEYWLVDTAAKTVTVLQWNAHRYGVVGVCGEGEVLRSPTLSEFEIKPDEIF